MIPSDADVLCGRGNSSALHPGNLHFRKYCWDLREQYKVMPRHEKRSLATSVLERVKSTGGRFLECDDRNVYVVASERRALEKACQALREKKWIIQKPKMFGSLNVITKPFVKREYKKREEKAPKNPQKINAKLSKASTPKKASTATSPDSQKEPISKSPEAETPKSMSGEIEIGTRIEVYWPLDQKYYAARVKAVNGSSAHLEYELDGVLEWLNLSEHIFRTIP